MPATILQPREASSYRGARRNAERKARRRVLNRLKLQNKTSPTATTGKYGEEIRQRNAVKGVGRPPGTPITAGRFFR